MVKVEQLSNDELIDMYIESAAEHRLGIDSGTVAQTNRAAHRIARVYRELRKRGSQSTRLLITLLDADNAGVRSWAAAHCLEFAPEFGEPVLKDLSCLPGLAGFSASMTLKVWRDGKLRFP